MSLQINTLFPLQNPTLVGDRVTLAAGDNDLYTVPAGRKAVLLSCQLFNPGAAAVKLNGQLKAGGVYYRTGADVTDNPNGAGLVQTAFPVMEAGESFSVHANGAVTAFWQVCEFDAATPLKSGRAVLGVGNNTLYTVPAGKTANLVQSNSGGYLSAVSAGGDATNSATLAAHVLKSGESVTAANRIVAGNVPANSFTSLTMYAPPVAAGGSVVVVADASGAFAWVNLFEG